MIKKLRDDRGETVVELLASILIGALSVALLFSAVTVSVRMDRTARETDEKLYESMRQAEERSSEIEPLPAGGISAVTISTDGSTDITLPVTFYGGRDVISYSLKPSSGGGGGT